MGRAKKEFFPIRDKIKTPYVTYKPAGEYPSLRGRVRSQTAI